MRHFAVHGLPIWGKPQGPQDPWHVGHDFGLATVAGGTGTLAKVSTTLRAQWVWGFRLTAADFIGNRGYRPNRALCYGSISPSSMVTGTNVSRSAVTRKLAAILIADVVGFSRHMERDDGGKLARLREIRERIVDPKMADHDGRIVKTAGDGTARIRQRRCGASLRDRRAAGNARR